MVATAFPLEDGHVDVEEDTLGNYKLSYDTKTASRTEQRFQDGRVIGSYSYVDLDGVKHTVTYLAAPEHGFGAEGADIPQPVHDDAVPVPESHELIKARNDHLTLVNMAKALGLHEDTPVPATAVLARLGDVPEIASLPSDFVPSVDADHLAARAELLAAYSHALSRLAEEYRRV